MNIRQPIKFIDLFAGIGGIRLPFDELGYECVFSSEWDKAACDSYEANFHEPPHDILLAGFPCQAFSIMGKMQGFADTRGTMFFEIERILARHAPSVVLLENVKQLTTHDKGRTFRTILSRLDNLGYNVKWKVLNALDFGLPQKRERVIIVGFRRADDYYNFNFDFPVVKYSLDNVLESDDAVDKSLFASEKILNKRRERVKDKNVFYPSVWHENKSGNISVLDYACALRTGASYNYLLINGRRRPSSRELLRFQGFPDTFRIVVPHQEIRKPQLADNCLDVFVWSNLAAIHMCTQNEKKINKIARHNRSIIWIYKMLFDFYVYGHFDYDNTINDLSYGTKNDKAFAISGQVSYPLLHSPELTKPRIRKDELKNIILGGGQNMLSPERRFDAIIVNSPELF